MFHSNTSGRVRAYVERLSEIITSNSVCLGCTFPPFSLNLVIDMLFEMTPSSPDILGADLPGYLLIDSDDIVMFGGDTDTMQSSDHIKKRSKDVLDALLSFQLQNLASELIFPGI